MQKLRYSELVRVSWLIVWRGTVGGAIFGTVAVPVLALELWEFYPLLECPMIGYAP